MKEKISPSKTSVLTFRFAGGEIAKVTIEGFPSRFLVSEKMFHDIWVLQEHFTTYPTLGVVDQSHRSRLLRYWSTLRNVVYTLQGFSQVTNQLAAGSMEYLMPLNNDLKVLKRF